MADDDHRTSTINVATAAPYDVLIGRRLEDDVIRLLGERPRRILVLHAPTVAAVAETLTAAVTAAGHEGHRIAVPDAEAAKTSDVAANCWRALGLAGFTRSDVVIGLGGGATTDLAGFVAATWLRGIEIVQVPTTVLAMVDAAVGGKTGINTTEGKNLVGAFWDPVGVVCDLSTLRTLARHELVAGFGEIVKCGFIADPVILDLIERDPGAATDPETAAFREIVERAVRVKAAVVAADPREAKLREILNYGHTFGHAIELVEDYRWRHGAAVSVGMVFAAELAVLAGRIDEDLVSRHRRILGSLGLPTGYRQDRWADLLTAMRRDKKARGDTVRFVVLDGLADPGRLDGPAPEMLVEAYARVSARGEE